MTHRLKRLAFLAAVAGLWLVPRGAALAQLSPAWVNAAKSDYRQRYAAFRQRYYSGGAPQWQGAQPSTQPAFGASRYRSLQQPQTWQQGAGQGRQSARQNERQWQSHPRWQAAPQGQRQPLGGWTRPAPHWQPRPGWQAGWPSQQSWQPGSRNWTYEGSLREQSLGQTVGTLIDDAVNGGR